MSKFKWGFLGGTGTKTEFPLYSLEPRNLEIVNPLIEGIETSLIDKIIGSENPNANFRHAPFHCNYRCSEYKEAAIGFVICSWSPDEIDKLTILFKNYMKEYLSKCYPESYQKHRMELLEVAIKRDKHG